MRTTPVGFFLLLVLLPITTSQAQSPPTITTRLVPKALYGAGPSQLIVTVKGDSLAGLTLRFTATRGFHVTPHELSWSGAAANRVVMCVADVTTKNVVAGQIGGSIMTTALLPDTKRVNHQVASDVAEFEYQAGLSVYLYLLVGVAGIGIGYVVRMLVLALKNVQPQVDAEKLATSETPKGLREFVLKHYWEVDFAVTLILGFLALVALMKDGRPPLPQFIGITLQCSE
jgi:hypothetical protein